MKRIAICFYGQPRNYLDGYYIIQELINNNKDCIFDFFIMYGIRKYILNMNVVHGVI